MVATSNTPFLGTAKPTLSTNTVVQHADETTNVIDKHPEVAANLSSAYDQWWAVVQPLMVNEDAVGPAVNPFQKLYYEHFGGSPSKADLEKMSRHLKPAGTESRSEKRQRNRKNKAEEKAQ